MDSKMAGYAISQLSCTNESVYTALVQQLCPIIKFIESSDFVGSNYSDMTCVSPTLPSLFGRKQSQILTLKLEHTDTLGSYKSQRNTLLPDK